MFDNDFLALICCIAIFPRVPINQVQVLTVVFRNAKKSLRIQVMILI
jgi:hypothetical protein